MSNSLLKTISFCLILTVYVWIMAVLILTKQSELLVLCSIVAIALLMWGIWYAFLRKKWFLMSAYLFICCTSFGVFGLALFDILDSSL